MSAGVRPYGPSGVGTTAGFIVSEANGYLSREAGVVKSGSGILVGGTLLGRETSSGKFVPLNPAGSGGAEVFAGILYEDVDARTADQKRTIWCRLGEVQRSALVFPGTPNDAQKNAAYAQMAAANITLR